MIDEKQINLSSPEGAGNQVPYAVMVDFELNAVDEVRKGNLRHKANQISICGAN